LFLITKKLALKLELSKLCNFTDTRGARWPVWARGQLELGGSRVGIDWEDPKVPRRSILLKLDIVFFKPDQTRTKSIQRILPGVCYCCVTGDTTGVTLAASKLRSGPECLYGVPPLHPRLTKSIWTHRKHYGVVFFVCFKSPLPPVPTLITDTGASTNTYARKTAACIRRTVEHPCWVGSGHFTRGPVSLFSTFEAFAGDKPRERPPRG